MFKQKQQNKQLSLRFRRWSRARYAVFVSLTQNVTIGVLSVSVSDKSTQKRASRKQLLLNNSKNNNENADSEVEPVEFNIQNEAVIVSIANSCDKAAAAGRQLISLFYKPNGWSRIILFQPFLFSHSL